MTRTRPSGRSSTPSSAGCNRSSAAMMARCSSSRWAIKGSYLHAAFGAPVAHDDDSSRAVAAALELRALPAELSYIQTVQIGISRGRMRVGAYGGATARTYDMMGDDANLAARLMSHAAPGQILVSRAIAEGVARLYELEFIGPLSVKGKSQPVRVALVQGRKAASPQRPASFFPSPLVGRDAEIGQMMQVLEAVAGGAGRILRLEGPTGVGKSHLAAALSAAAADQGFLVAVGACQSTTEHTAYAPWRQVFAALLDLPAVTGRRPARNRWRSAWPMWSKSSARSTRPGGCACPCSAICWTAHPRQRHDRRL